MRLPALALRQQQPHLRANMQLLAGVKDQQAEQNLFQQLTEPLRVATVLAWKPQSTLPPKQAACHSGPPWPPPHRCHRLCAGSAGLLLNRLPAFQEDLGRLLTWHCEWASDCVNTLQLLSSAAWIYSLAACLEKPVPASCAAGLRSLLRSAAAARALCTSADERLPVLSLLIATAGYFGQDEDTVVLLQEHFV